MKGFLNNCDDIPKWELESVRWIDTQEHLGFCFTQLHFNAEQHKPRNCKTSISRFVLRITNTASLYLQIVLQPWGEVSLPAQNSYCHVHKQRLIIALPLTEMCSAFRGASKPVACVSFPETVPTVLQLFFTDFLS